MQCDQNRSGSRYGVVGKVDAMHVDEIDGMGGEDAMEVLGVGVGDGLAEL